MSAPTADLAALIRTVSDFPRAGVRFRDVTTLFRDADGFARAIDAIASAFRDERIDKVAGIESRGFIVGAPVAYALRAGFVPVRKPGKLPAARYSRDYALEYGRDRLELHHDAIAAGERVLVVDDLVATGGTAIATLELVALAGGVVAGCAFIVDLPELHGRARIERLGHRVLALCSFAGA